MGEQATLVVTAVPNPNEMESVHAYLQGVMPLFMQAGGNLVKRLKTEAVLNGNPAGLTLVMDFGSPEAITELFASDAYAALIPTRDTGFQEMNILMTRSM